MINYFFAFACFPYLRINGGTWYHINCTNAVVCHFSCRCACDNGNDADDIDDDYFYYVDDDSDDDAVDVYDDVDGVGDNATAVADDDNNAADDNYANLAERPLCAATI